MLRIGAHCVLEMYGCPAVLLNDLAEVRGALHHAVQRSGCTPLREASHRFESQDATVVGLLAESHISIHPWPESGDAAADLFTCADAVRAEQACRELARVPRAQRFELTTIDRGMRVPSARPRRVPVDAEDVA